jgi:uncharacterized protein YbbC (DUF1343 family)
MKIALCLGHHFYILPFNQRSMILRRHLSQLPVIFSLTFFVAVVSCAEIPREAKVEVGATQTADYFPLIEGKALGLVVNHTSVLDTTHLVDFLLAKGMNIKGIYAPEHGFKGTVERGKDVAHSVDPETEIAIFSIYGSNKKPSPEVLQGIEVMLFDMQDVGVRFFTYISTLHYVMEACAENNIPVIILDRPNPIGYIIDGPVLDTAYSSFIGMHPVPIAHGMTIGEYGQMINGEKWLKNGVQCDLTVVKVANYTHEVRYQMPVGPSPNLPDMRSVYLYPSTCLFEGTEVSEGRGTLKPFQQFGTPYYTPQTHSFVPEPIPGLSADPKYKGQTCYGYDLTEVPLDSLKQITGLNLSYILDFYAKSPDQTKFFDKFIELLSGGPTLRDQIIAGKTEEEIKASWQPELRAFRQKREKYLLYR